MQGNILIPFNFCRICITVQTSLYLYRLQAGVSRSICRLPLRFFLTTLMCLVTGDILIGGGGGVNPTMDLHPVQGGVVMLLDMLHSKDSGISSGCLGL